jgi:hypothetical protein
MLFFAHLVPVPAQSEEVRRHCVSMISTSSRPIVLLECVRVSDLDLDVYSLFAEIVLIEARWLHYGVDWESANYIPGDIWRQHGLARRFLRFEFRQGWLACNGYGGSLIKSGEIQRRSLPAIHYKVVDGWRLLVCHGFAGQPEGRNVNPWSFIQLKSADALSETPLGDIRGTFRSIGGVSGGVGCLLGDDSLPYSNSYCAEGRNHQGSREPSQSIVGFDLRTCELVLLVLASLAGCLFLFHRSIKNDSIPFSVVRGVYVILFLIGQFAVYLIFKRIYGI